MEDSAQRRESILLAGSNHLIYSVAICLQNAGHAVILIAPEPEKANYNLALDAASYSVEPKPGSIRIIPDTAFEETVYIAIAVTEENLLVKKSLLAKLENIVPRDTLIAINTESIPLSELQRGASIPDRILGVNWVEPANTTFFLEIIANDISRKSLVDNLYQTAVRRWKKDPYVIRGDAGIRMKLFAAMLREAFYLLENDYATVADIDRACRNDAGYYLPFAGNLRYMDLMGTYAYGLVMNDLNSVLATDQRAPGFFYEMQQKGRLGMESGHGFYNYQPGENEKWRDLLNRFSHQVSSLIEKYPFNTISER